MKKLIGYEYVDMTPEEVAEFEQRSNKSVNLPHKVTDRERISALENAIADLAVMLVGGVNND